MNPDRKNLTKLIDESSAVALMILHGDSVAASAGLLSENGFRLLRTALLRYWHDVSQRDLNRYMELSLDNRFFLLFAKFMPTGDDLLGLVFPLQTPLIRIRQDMTDIQRAFVEQATKAHEADLPLEQSLQVEPISSSATDPDISPKPFSAGWHPEQDQEKNVSEEVSVAEERNAKPEQSNREASASPKRYLTYGAPLNGVPSVSPQKVSSEQEDIPWHLIGESIPDADEELESIPDGEVPNFEQGHDSWQPLGEVTHAGDDLVNILQDDYEVKDDGVDAGGWTLPPVELSDSQVEVGSLKEEDDTSQTAIHGEDAGWEMGVSEITFYLVPRLETHYLLGELAQRLRKWLPVICQRYGWQLSLLSVRPDYLKWRLSDFPESLIQQMLQTVREETSERIFHVFPDLQTGNQSRDYWAPGYLVDNQNRDFSTQALMTHISGGRLGDT